ncbi:acyl-CoA dehydrogenase family protein [Streptomyces sp. NPDC050529]|uniref:acyl-CoA dehydrogenase family protein n=1 Tax=unclassified Streptomyces TaxID=2593676 RepID=UPI002DD81320|nr:acyl-CoA dehydrogenase family protein [Streptomyces sp. NBC_01022]WRZ79172.1 acyl-CoA dehydrogenase family protein [Streptomyces sp. NBC_01022]WRZ86504.1 acyl-CoA dehydrogenase family protein [Streptomyces sp. NBC_01022]
MRRSVFTEDHEAFRATVRAFIAEEVVPHYADWERQGHVPRELYRKLGALGVLGINVPQEYGGAGVTDFTYQAVLREECGRAGVGFGAESVHTCLVLPYLLEFGNEQQKRRWLPGFLSGEIMTAIAMTEPGTGSDLAGIATRARLSEDGTHYVLEGAKTFITGGAQADLVLVVCRTAAYDPADRRGGLSILCVDTSSEGFAVGRKLDKIGLRAQDTAELSFTDVRVPVENLLGEEGAAFRYLTHNLAVERLGAAINAYANAAGAIGFATTYVRERQVFGRPLAAFQNSKFVLAECATEVAAAQALVDRALTEHAAGDLTAADAARAKLFCTEVAGRVIDKCLQLHGGYGYMLEYPIARLYADTRVNRIYAGTSEVMKTIIAKDLGL